MRGRIQFGSRRMVLSHLTGLDFVPSLLASSNTFGYLTGVELTCYCYNCRWYTDLFDDWSKKLKSGICRLRDYHVVLCLA